MALEDLGGVAAAAPPEPEALVLPPGAVAQLLGWALRTEPGAAWWRGFLAGCGEPAWAVAGRWALRTQGAEVVRVPGPPPNGRAEG